MSERIDDPTFKAYDQAIKEVYDKDTFSFGGYAYEKSGGSTFLKTDQVPGGSVEVHPNAAAGIDAKRLQQEVDKQKVQIEPDTRQKYRMASEEEIKQALDSPALPIMNAIGGAVVLGGLGAAAGAITGTGAAVGGVNGLITGAGGALYSGTPDYMKDHLENVMRTRPTVPLFENMTPEEIGSHYGHM